MSVPEWDVTKCIQCNQCAYVCPHATIRPFAFSAEEAAAAYLKGRTLADEIAALAALTVDDANELLRTALREENRAYVQIDPAE